MPPWVNGRCHQVQLLDRVHKTLTLDLSHSVNSPSPPTVPLPLPISLSPSPASVPDRDREREVLLVLEDLAPGSLVQSQGSWQLTPVVPVNAPLRLETGLHSLLWAESCNEYGNASELTLEEPLNSELYRHIYCPSQPLHIFQSQADRWHCGLLTPALRQDPGNLRLALAQNFFLIEAKAAVKFDHPTPAWSSLQHTAFEKVFERIQTSLGRPDVKWTVPRWGNAETLLIQQWACLYYCWKFKEISSYRQLLESLTSRAEVYALQRGVAMLTSKSLELENCLQWLAQVLSLQAEAQWGWMRERGVNAPWLASYHIVFPALTQRVTKLLQDQPQLDIPPKMIKLCIWVDVDLCESTSHRNLLHHALVQNDCQAVINLLDFWRASSWQMTLRLDSTVALASAVPQRLNLLKLLKDRAWAETAWAFPTKRHQWWVAYVTQTSPILGTSPSCFLVEKGYWAAWALLHGPVPPDPSPTRPPHHETLERFTLDQTSQYHNATDSPDMLVALRHAAKALIKLRDDSKRARTGAVPAHQGLSPYESIANQEESGEARRRQISLLVRQIEKEYPEKVPLLEELFKDLWRVADPIARWTPKMLWYPHTVHHHTQKVALVYQKWQTEIPRRLHPPSRYVITATEEMAHTLQLTPQNQIRDKLLCKLNWPFQGWVFPRRENPTNQDQVAKDETARLIQLVNQHLGQRLGVSPQLLHVMVDSQNPHNLKHFWTKRRLPVSDPPHWILPNHQEWLLPSPLVGEWYQTPDYTLRIHTWLWLLGHCYGDPSNPYYISLLIWLLGVRWVNWADRAEIRWSGSEPNRVDSWDLLSLIFLVQCRVTVLLPLLVQHLAFLGDMWEMLFQPRDWSQIFIPNLAPSAADDKQQYLPWQITSVQAASATTRPRDFFSNPQYSCLENPGRFQWNSPTTIWWRNITRPSLGFFLALGLNKISYSWSSQNSRYKKVYHWSLSCLLARSGPWSWPLVLAQRPPSNPKQLYTAPIGDGHSTKTYVKLPYDNYYYGWSLGCAQANQLLAFWHHHYKWRRQLEDFELKTACVEMIRDYGQKYEGTVTRTLDGSWTRKRRDAKWRWLENYFVQKVNRSSEKLDAIVMDEKIWVWPTLHKFWVDMYLSLPPER